LFTVYGGNPIGLYAEEQILPADTVVNDPSSTSPIAAHDWLDATPWLLQSKL